LFIIPFEQNNLSYLPISDAQYAAIEEQLKVVYFDCTPHAASQYYPVPFQEATQLLKFDLSPLFSPLKLSVFFFNRVFFVVYRAKRWLLCFLF
jgi:hypothetical protein